MDQLQQARHNFEQAAYILFETEEKIRAGGWRLSPGLYDRWITAKLHVWLTFERWRKLRFETGDASAQTSDFPIQLKYGLGIRSKRAAYAMKPGNVFRQRSCLEKAR
jgi:hypothetical protein